MPTIDINERTFNELHRLATARGVTPADLIGRLIDHLVRCTDGTPADGSAGSVPTETTHPSTTAPCASLPAPSPDTPSPALPATRCAAWHRPGTGTEPPVGTGGPSPAPASGCPERATPPPRPGRLSLEHLLALAAINAEVRRTPERDRADTDAALLPELQSGPRESVPPAAAPDSRTSPRN